MQHWVDESIPELENLLRSKVVQVHKLCFAQQEGQLALANNSGPVSILNVDRNTRWSKASYPPVLPVGVSLPIDGLDHRNDLSQQPWVQCVRIRVQMRPWLISWQPSVCVCMSDNTFTAAGATLPMVVSLTSTIFLGI